MVARLLRNRNKPVSPACYCFDVAGSGGRVSQGPAKSMYALVEAALEINQSIVLPQMLLELLSRAYLSGIFQQQRQDFGSLRLQLDLKSVPPQLTGLRTELEDSKQMTRRVLAGFFMARGSVHEATGEGTWEPRQPGPTSESPKIGEIVAPNLVQI